MDNFRTRYRNRRYIGLVSILGTTQLHLRSPLTIALWSLAFPGFGHLLVNKYLRGYALFLWELFINQITHLNLALVYSFNGQIEAAKSVLNERYTLLYVPVYLFAVWDSYRTTVDLNKITLLASRENAPFNNFAISPLEINYLDKRKPWIAFVWSMTVPSLGQLYIHRIVLAIFTMSITIVIVALSGLIEGVHYLILGQVAKSNSVLDPQWLLYFPSLYFYTIYDAYVNTVENNKLFDLEQRKFLTGQFQSPSFVIQKEPRSMQIQIFAAFDHSIFLELAISKLKENDIRDIYAVPLDKRKEDMRMFDNIHQSDGISLIDIGMICAFLGGTIGAARGFAMDWGPIYWGLIGAGIGFAVGFAIDLIQNLVKRKKLRVSKHRGSEVILIVTCSKDQAKQVEHIMWEHMARAMAATRTSAGTVQEGT